MIDHHHSMISEPVVLLGTIDLRDLPGLELRLAG
jgi:hypothetical protein